MLKKIQLHISIQQPFGNLFRKNTVLILCETHKQTFLVGEKKNFYPQGIYRLIGGGVEANRDKSFIEAAQNELREEISYKPNAQDLAKFGEVEVLATANNQVRYKHTVHLFYIKLPKGVNIKAGSDISNIRELSLKELKNLAQKYTQLPKDLSATEGSLTYSWFDYGQMYGPIHKLAVSYIQHRNTLVF